MLSRSASDRDGLGNIRLSKIECVLGTWMSQNASRDQRLACVFPELRKHIMQKQGAISHPHKLSRFQRLPILTMSIRQAGEKLDGNHSKKKGFLVELAVKILLIHSQAETCCAYNNEETGMKRTAGLIQIFMLWLSQTIRINTHM